MNIKNFQDLEIWKNALGLSKTIYDLSNAGSFSKDFGLRDQIRRAVVSIISNIAEGFERNNNNEFIYFLRIAKGSAGEVRSQLFVASLVGYIAAQERDALVDEFTKLSSQIGAFIVYLQKYRQNNQDNF